MNDLGDIIAPVASVVGMVLGALAAVNAYKGRKAAERAESGMIEVDGKIYRLDERVDGRLSQLLEANAAKATTAANLARAEGHAAGEQAQRDRSSEAQA